MSSLLIAIVSFAVAAAQEPAYRLAEPGVAAPVVVKDVQPQYTPDAITARVEGSVKLGCVVTSAGAVSDATVVQSLHPSLDAAALKALSQWQFKPGTKDGKPVAVRVEIEMTFTLRDRPQPTHRGPALGMPEVLKKEDVTTLPVVVRETKPTYPPSAMREGVQGSVKLECVVLTDGTVGDVRVKERLHPELDEEAMRSLRQWTFKPGTKDGAAVPVQIEVEMTFTLRPDKPKSPAER
jgi:TonB family protein